MFYRSLKLFELRRGTIFSLFKRRRGMRLTIGRPVLLKSIYLRLRVLCRRSFRWYSIPTAWNSNRDAINTFSLNKLSGITIWVASTLIILVCTIYTSEGEDWNSVMIKRGAASLHCWRKWDIENDRWRLTGTREVLHKQRNRPLPVIHQTADAQSTAQGTTNREPLCAIYHEHFSSNKVSENIDRK